MPERSPLLDEMIAHTPDWRGAALARLRKIIHEADPEISEDVKWRRPSNPMGAALWTHAGVVCIGGILKERVRLTLVTGSSLPDPHKLFNAMLLGKSRAIDLSEGDTINEKELKAIIRSAVELNLLRRGPVKTPRRPVKAPQKPAKAPRKPPKRRPPRAR